MTHISCILAGVPIVTQGGTGCSEGDETTSSARDISDNFPRSSMVRGATTRKRMQVEVELEKLETETFGKPLKDTITDYMDSEDEVDVEMQDGDQSPGIEWGSDKV